MRKDLRVILGDFLNSKGRWGDRRKRLMFIEIYKFFLVEFFGVGNLEEVFREETLRGDKVFLSGSDEFGFLGGMEIVNLRGCVLSLENKFGIGRRV